METWGAQREHDLEADEVVHSLFVDRNHKVFLVEYIDLRGPLPNAFVAGLLASMRQFGQTLTKTEHLLLFDCQLLIKERTEEVNLVRKARVSVS